MKAFFIFTILVGLVVSSTRAQAQFSLDGPPNIIQSKIETVDDVTTYTYVTRVPNCRYIDAEPVYRTGTNLMQVITERPWTGICTACFDCYGINTNTTSFGTLEPGDYDFKVFYRSSIEFPYPDYFLGLTNYTFTVEKKLQKSPRASVDAFSFDVEGEPSQQYIVQSSSNLVDWVPQLTNSGPFTFSADLISSNAFYRTVIKPAE